MKTEHLNTEHLISILTSHMANAIEKAGDHLHLIRIKQHAGNLISLLRPGNQAEDFGNEIPEGVELAFLQTLAEDISKADAPPAWMEYLARRLRIAPVLSHWERQLPEALSNVPTYSHGDEFKDVICPNPFLYLELRANGDMYPCCYVPFPIGNIQRQSLEEIWHSPAAVALRRSIRDGSFKFCDKGKCAGMQKTALSDYRPNNPYQVPYELFRKSELGARGLGYLAEDAPERKVPLIISFDDDLTCNLACPSCRGGLQAVTGEDAAQIYRNDCAILDAIDLGIRELWFSGAGDPFASNIYRTLFTEHDWNRHPGLKIRLDTNGMLLTERLCSSVLGGIRDNIYLIAVSLDATNPETYSAIRKGGDFATVIANLRHLSGLMTWKNDPQLVLRMIVQAGNYREMGDFVDLGKELGAARVVFSAISNWGTFGEETFRNLAVHEADSRHHQEFRQVLLDPRLRDPIVDMGNLTNLFHRNLVSRLSAGISVQDVIHEGTLLPRDKRALAIAFYLPQFHPIPENDAWWGKGFTEWTNVTKAGPLFQGHYQPHLPADLGFYDLRVGEVREQQADLARKYGIDAFCYWHYWFAGKRLLERPFQEVVSSGKPDFPFCLGWANQTWSGIWHGAPDRILIEQTYPGLEDYRAHFNALLPAFRDPRYLRVKGRLLFVIYAPRDLPDTRVFTGYWQNLAKENGLGGFHFVAHNVRNPEDYGCHTCVDNAPFVAMPSAPLPVSPLGKDRLPRVHHYGDLVRFLKNYELADKEHPLVVPNWDNTPRSGANGLVLQGSTPALFREMMADAVVKVERKPDPAERIIFIKAWNEWAEGNHLEPDNLYGYGYLEAVRESLFPCYASGAEQA